jgi:SAM-dependent methyltransferase
MSEQEYRDMVPGYDPGDFLEGQSVEQIHKFLSVPRRAELLNEMIGSAGRSPHGLTFLDVGCGMGGYMTAAQQLGMTAMGFEPSANHGKLAKTVLGLDVVADYFSSDKVGARKFDVILLSHVIEHILQPKPFIEDLLSVLNPGGLLIMVTPNANSLSARITGRHWPMLVPIDHVTMLTKRSVPHLLPQGHRSIVSTSEFPSEFFATIGSIVKGRLKGRNINHSDIAPRSAPKLMVQKNLRSQMLRFALAAASTPFRAWAHLTGEAAALRIVFVKTR